MVLANAGHARAHTFGMPAGIGAMEDPDRRSTRSWAEAFHVAGFERAPYRVSQEGSHRPLADRRRQTQQFLPLALVLGLGGQAGGVDDPTPSLAGWPQPVLVSQPSRVSRSGRRARRAAILAPKSWVVIHSHNWARFGSKARVCSMSSG